MWYGSVSTDVERSDPKRTGQRSGRRSHTISCHDGFVTGHDVMMPLFLYLDRQREWESDTDWVCHCKWGEIKRIYCECSGKGFWLQPGLCVQEVMQTYTGVNGRSVYLWKSPFVLHHYTGLSWTGPYNAYRHISNTEVLYITVFTAEIWDYFCIDGVYHNQTVISS